MGQISSKLRDVQDNGLMFYCPGCQHMHAINHGPGRWSWNGDAERPIFSPSVLVQRHDFTPAGRVAFEAWRAAGAPKPAPEFESAPTVCHSYVGCNGARPGEIVFLSDCTHALAGQVVDLPDLPAWARDDAA